MELDSLPPRRFLPVDTEPRLDEYGFLSPEASETSLTVVKRVVSDQCSVDRPVGETRGDQPLNTRNTLKPFGLV